MRTFSYLAAIVMLGSVAAADDLEKLFKEKVSCDRYFEPGAEPKEPGLLSFEKTGLCRDRTKSRVELPLWGPGCATAAGCGMRPVWDDKLKIWRPYRRNR